jgi:hypothetical protein
MKNTVLAFLVLSLCIGCDGATLNPNPFAGTWLGHGELTETDKPIAGQTTVTTIDDVITFNADMTFSLDQGYRQTVDGVLAMSAYQKGAGTYAYAGDTTGILTMTFGTPSDPSLSNDTPACTFSGDKKTCTIQPTNITFPLVFEKVP